MKKAIILSLIVGIFAGVIYFGFNAKGIYEKNLRLNFILRLSLSNISSLNKDAYYGQKDFNMLTYIEIFKKSNFRTELMKNSTDLKVESIDYDYSEDAKIFSMVLRTRNKDIKNGEEIGIFVEKYFGRITGKMANNSREYIMMQRNDLKNKMDLLKNKLEESFKSNAPERYGLFYKKYKVSYGNPLILGDIPNYLNNTAGNQSALFLENLPNMENIKIKFDNDLISYIYNMQLFNQTLATMLRLESIENDLALLSVSKLSPIYLLGVSVYRNSMTKLLIRSFIIFIAFFILFFTFFYVAKKDR